MLENAAQHPVCTVHPEKILELVERDEASDSRPVVELRRQVQQAEQHALDVDPRVCLQRRGEPSGAERKPDLPRAEQRVDRAPHRAPERAVVRTLDPDDDTREREHAFEIDERRRPLRVGSVGEHAAQQARLPVTTGRDEARGVPSRGEREQPGGLGIAVDHLVAEKLASDPERVGDVHEHPPSLHDANRFVYIE